MMLILLKHREVIAPDENMGLFRKGSNVMEFMDPPPEQKRYKIDQFERQKKCFEVLHKANHIQQL